METFYMPEWYKPEDYTQMCAIFYYAFIKMNQNPEHFTEWFMRSNIRREMEGYHPTYSNVGCSKLYEILVRDGYYEFECVYKLLRVDAEWIGHFYSVACARYNMSSAQVIEYYPYWVVSRICALPEDRDWDWFFNEFPPDRAKKEACGLPPIDGRYDNLDNTPPEPEEDTTAWVFEIIKDRDV